MDHLEVQGRDFGGSSELVLISAEVYEKNSQAPVQLVGDHATTLAKGYKQSKNRHDLSHFLPLQQGHTWRWQCCKMVGPWSAWIPEGLGRANPLQLSPMDLSWKCIRNNICWVKPVETRSGWGRRCAICYRSIILPFLINPNYWFINL